MPKAGTVAYYITIGHVEYTKILENNTIRMVYAILYGAYNTYTYMEQAEK